MTASVAGGGPAGTRGGGALEPAARGGAGAGAPAAGRRARGGRGGSGEGAGLARRRGPPRGAASRRARHARELDRVTRRVRVLPPTADGGPARSASGEPPCPRASGRRRRRLARRRAAAAASAPRAPQDPSRAPRRLPRGLGRRRHVTPSRPPPGLPGLGPQQRNKIKKEKRRKGEAEERRRGREGEEREKKGRRGGGRRRRNNGRKKKTGPSQTTEGRS